MDRALAKAKPARPYRGTIATGQAAYPLLCRIAEKCSQHIQSGDSIFLDGSTTCWFVARQLANKNLTVLTTSLQIATILAASPTISLILIGGAFSPKSMAFLGDNACRALSNYYVDKAFISCRSVSMENWMTDVS